MVATDRFTENQTKLSMFCLPGSGGPARFLMLNNVGRVNANHHKPWNTREIAIAFRMLSGSTPMMRTMICEEQSEQVQV